MGCRDKCRGRANVSRAALQHKITIRQNTGSSLDGGGQVIPVMGPYGTFWAENKSQSGREFYQARKVHADITHLWEVPWSQSAAAVTTEMQLVFNSRTMEILSVINVDEDDRVVRISARETKA